MGRILIVLIVVVVIVSLAAGAIATFFFKEVNGSGNVITESRDVGTFKRVSICCGMQLQVTQSSPASLQLEGDDNILAAIVTSVKGDLLTINYRAARPGYRPSQPIIARVTMPEVSGLTVSGGGRLEATALKTQQLEIGLSGGSAGMLSSLTSADLRTSISGGGVLEVTGTATHQSLRASGGSHYQGAQLQSQSAEIDISGGGSAIIWAEDELVIKASGGGDISYYGTPNVSQNTSGGSKVRSLGEQP